MKWYYLILVHVLFSNSILAGEWETANFSVTATTATASESTARQVAETAEKLRRRISNRYFGNILPDWSKPCQVIIKDRIESRATISSVTFTISRNHPSISQMEMLIWTENLPETLHSLLPHEVCHLVVASQCKKMPPRWLDEGMAILVEPESVLRDQYTRTRRMIAAGDYQPLAILMNQGEYFAEEQANLNFYAQSTSLTHFLAERGNGERTFMHLLADPSSESVSRQFGFGSIEELESAWNDWMFETAIKEAENGVLAQAE